MYRTKIPLKPSIYSHLPHAIADARISLSARGRFDRNLRQKLLLAHDGDHICVTDYALTFNQQEFWYWYADTLKTRLTFYTNPGYDPLPAYDISQGVVHFTSAKEERLLGGIESAVTSSILYGASRIHIPDCDYAWERYGLIEGYLAILGASLGFSVTVLGDERYSGPEDRTKGEEFSVRFGIEQTESWWRMWNQYLASDPARPTLQSVVGSWTKEELLVKLCASPDTDWSHIQSCDDVQDGKWCGRCWKCGTVKLWLTHLGKPSSFINPLTPQLLNTMRAEFADYQRGHDPLRSCGFLEPVLYLLKDNHD